MKVPLPSWAKTTIAALSVAASVSTAWAPVFIANHKAKDQTFIADHKAKDETLTKFIDVQTREAARHQRELPSKTEDIPIADGAEKLQLRHYKTDSCIQAVRSTPDGVITSSIWVPRFDPNQFTPAPGPTGDVQQVGSSKPLSTPNSGPSSRGLPLVATLLPHRLPLAAFSTTEPVEQNIRPVQACAGHCTDPHPGQPTITYGKTNGCWVQVVRTWADRCSQYQWYDTCHSLWDPKIYWTCCND